MNTPPQDNPKSQQSELDELVEEMLAQAPALVTHEELAEYKARSLALLNKRIEFVIGENEQPHPTDRTLDASKQARNLLRAEQRKRKRLGDITK